jgi:hypothetical protein
MSTVKYCSTQMVLSGLFGEQCVPARTRLSSQGRAVLIREHSVDHSFRFYFDNAAFPGGFDRCHLPSKEQKEALLREVRKTDPEYSLAKLIHWFSNRRKRLYHESKKDRKDGKEDVLSTLLDSTTSLARESRPSIILRYTP